jgi:two-component SAPR family response regulator
MIQKKTFYNRIIRLIALFLFAVCSHAQDLQYGLKFKSYEVEKEKRTSLNLTPEKPLSLPSRYTISFDLKFNSDGIDPFGYVFRIFDEEGRSISLLLNIVKNTFVNRLVFTYSAEELFGMTFDEVGMKFDKWQDIKVAIDTKQTLVTVTVGGKEFSRVIMELGAFDKINVIFGRNNHLGSQITDIPSMTVKNIRIYDDRRQTLLYEWLLKKYTENGSYDEMNHKLATVDNPDWILNRHVFWEKKISLVTGKNTQMAYNPGDNEIGVYNQALFYKYGLSSGEMKVDTLKSIVPWGSQSNNMLYDPNSGNYVYYTFELEKTTDVLFYNLDVKAWSKIPDKPFPPDYWHHNRLISKHDGKMYLFGGYGYHKYKNDVHIYDFLTKEWRKAQLTGDVPFPHYLSGLGVLDDKHVLIFGGYGSETGNQSLGPRFFYDLYKINTETLESEKLWTLDDPENDFVVSNSIVIDTAARTFYALTYSLRQFYTSLNLLKFSIDKPQYEVLSDSIPINFEDTYSYVDLFLDRKSNNLVALASGPTALHSQDDEISIYTLTYPPLAKSELHQKTATKEFKIWLLVPVIFIIAVCVILAVLIYNRKKRSFSSGGEPGAVESRASLPGDKHESVAVEKTNEATLCRSVFLFGGFRVMDKNRRDVTNVFTPMLKQLFLLILLYTYKNRKGISSTKLKEILWYDKSEDSAKNNRGVSVRKLRHIFENVGDIQIKNENSYWTVELGRDVYCDYSTVLYLMDRLSGKERFEMVDLRKLISILSGGEFLPNLQVEWVDSFKADLSNSLLDILLDLSKNKQVLKDPQLCVDLADVIFIHDSLNEEALSLKCAMLVKMGRNKLSKNVYEAFTKEYRHLFGTDFVSTFERIISPD